VQHIQYLSPQHMEEIKHFINGQDWTGNQHMDVVEPATGRPYARLPLGSHTEVEAAVTAAAAAFPAWAGLPAEQRATPLLKMAELLRNRQEELAQMESRDSGKPLWLTRKVDIPRAARNLEFFATAIQHQQSEAHPMQEGLLNLTLRKPLGVVGCISPWNLPLYLFTWKIAPALAAGNTVVAKPSEITPYTAFVLGQIAREAGLPDGVLNILHGTGPEVGGPLVAHPQVAAISFTGGTATGKAIASVAAPMFKKLSLEMGGKNPNIIFDDADMEKALDSAVRSSFTNQGEICLCGSRIFIQENIYESFRDAFVARVKQLNVGAPEDPNSFMGALVSEQHLQKVLNYRQLALDEGGTMLCGDEPLSLPSTNAKGYFMRPTVFEGLGPACRINQEEVFGPLVTLQPFRDEAEALALANDSAYGLAAQLWTNDLGRAHRMSERLNTGIVWVNCWMVRDLRTPFGGMKHSGVGREGGWEALRFFTEPKNVCLNYSI
jgi:aminomuconate-semialdehyde/2-hydroxymuconate-6-semialdehyde dehydrogenase